MPTRFFFPILPIASAGLLVAACGAHDRFFDDTDSGAPPVDSSSGSDARSENSTPADQRSELQSDAPSADAPRLDASDARADATIDARADVPAEGGTPDGVGGDAGPRDSAPSDTLVSDATNLEGGSVDASPDILDCGGTSAPTITPAGTVAICPGKMVTLTSSAAVNYSWSTAATTRAIDVGMAGSYNVTTTDSRGCTATSPPTVVSVYPAPSAPRISASGPTRICSGSNVTLSTAAASSYAWSTGATTQSIVVSTSGSYVVTTTDANGCAATSAALAVTVVVPARGSRAYTFTGAPDSFVVPECVTTVDIDALGAQGGSSNATGAGGYGGRVQARLSVTPGAVLQIRVGGAGVLCSVDNGGGFNGGGVANCAGTAGAPSTLYSATGGGATDIRVSPYGLDDRVIVVGGGGGAGYNCGSVLDSGGVGGGSTGGTFVTDCGTHPESAGGGGTQLAGGLGGTYPGYGYAGNGSAGQGGVGVCTGGTSISAQGGGGGGGYFGGGGGCWVGGGGGSDYLRTTVAALLAPQEPGKQAGHGALAISW